MSHVFTGKPSMKQLIPFPRSKSKFNKAIQQNVEQLMDIQSALKAFEERGTMDISNKKCNQLSPGEESSTNKEPQVHPTQVSFVAKRHGAFDSSPFIHGDRIACFISFTNKLLQNQFNSVSGQSLYI